MKLLDLAKEVAALAGYNITGTDTQAVADKARALRRVNLARSKVAAHFSGRWASLYREGWLPLVPVYNTGTVTVTQGSRTITGSGTTWTSAMVGRKFLGPNGEYYKIASFVSTTSLILTEQYQGSTASGGIYQIWKDEYLLYPDVYSIIDFVNYIDPAQMTEDTNKHGRMIYPRSTTNATPTCFSVIGRQRVVVAYATGTVSIAVGGRTLTGVGTSWFDNVQPGFEVTMGSYTYHVDTVDSDTQITIHEYAVAVASGATYSATGRNALKVRFLQPSSQTIVGYGYYSKVYPLVNDSDEDWLIELYPHLIINEVTINDHIDKKDPNTVSLAMRLFENDLSDAHTSDASQYGGVPVVGLDIPGIARL